MTQELLEKLGIDPTLPAERIQEELEEKNLEYLERLDACEDEERLARLRAEQQEIELALQECREGKLLPAGKTAKKKPATDSRPKAAPAGGDYAEGVKRFKAGDMVGALQILKKYADQGEEQPCILTARIFKAQGDENNYRRYLFAAAQKGSGEAALMLAQSYFENGETNSAYKWAQRAHTLHTVGAGQLIMRLLTEEKKWEEALKVAAEEIEWLTEYDRYSMCGDIRTLLDGGHYSDEKIVELIGPMETVLAKDPVSWQLLEASYRSAADRERKRQEKLDQEEARRQREERQRKEKLAAERAEQVRLAVAQSRKKRTKMIARIIFALFLVAIAAGVYYYFTEIRPSQKYETAQGLVKEGEYAQAEAIFRELGEYKDAESRLRAAYAAHYAAAQSLEASGQVAQAAVSYGTLGDYRDAKKKCHALWIRIYPYSVAVGRGVGLYAAVKTDGTMLPFDDEDDDGKYSEVVAVTFAWYGFAGLKTDGTVVITDKKKQKELGQWRDIIAIAGGEKHIVGLKADGTVVASGENGSGQCETADWKNVIAVSANDHCTVGLLADGTVISTDGNRYDWTGIREVACGDGFVVGLRQDGTAVASDGAGTEITEAVSTWGNVSHISAGRHHVVGFRWDCGVWAAGKNDDGRCDVEGWNVAMAVADEDETIGLQWDGTWVRAGKYYDKIPDWTGIRVPGSVWEEN